MGGKQSFIKVVSLPYPFSLNTVSFAYYLVGVVSFAYSLVRVVSFAYSLVRVVSLPYPFSLNAVSFMVASRSSLCLLLRQGRQFCLLPH